MLQQVGSTALLLGVLVFVHELGHFLVAKACGVKVLRFSLGFGPRVFGFTRGETEYRLAWLPLGGYVKMAGELPYEELPPEEAARGFLAQPPWKRMLIVAAGPVFNLLFPILVFFFVFLGAHEVPSSRVGSVEPGSPAAEAQLQPGDRILKVDGEKIEAFNDISQALSTRFGKPTPITIERENKQLVITLTPAKSVESNGVEMQARGKIGISPYAKPPVLGVPSGSDAERAGLKTFDRVVSINGHPVKDEVAFRHELSAAQGELSLEVERSEPLAVPGVAASAPRLVPVKLQKRVGEGYAALGVESADSYVSSVVPGSAADKAGLRPGDRLLTFNGGEIKSLLMLEIQLSQIGEAPFELAWRSNGQTKSASLRQTKIKVDEEGQIEQLDLGVRAAGFSAADASSIEKIVRHMGVGEAFAASLRTVPEVIGKTAMMLGMLVTGRVPLTNLASPIGISRIAAKSAQQGWDAFLQLMALISVNLGLMNLLPIPILDGFHLVAAGWEAIRRRPIPMRAREIANWVGLAMLVALMVLAFKNDLSR